MGDLTRNFSRSEFACQGIDCCGNSSPVAMALVDALQQLRDLVGQPLIVTSGFRCRTHNHNIGGAENSQHCLGTAADISCPGIDPAKLAALAETIPVFATGGIGIYPAWVHVDIRSTGPARWTG